MTNHPLGTRQATLARVVRLSKGLAERFFVGFDDHNRTRQAPGLPNHLAWNLGHLALTMHRAIEKLDGSTPPESDFVAGPSGDADRFGIESVSFASVPSDDPGTYPAVSRARAIFDAAIERLAATVERATDAQLETLVAWGGGQTPWADLVARMAFHNGVHTGQIIDLRRALGMKGVLG